MAATVAVPRSGQARIDAKRSQRGEFWRSVKIRVGVGMEPFFLEHLRLLGPEARIQGRTQCWNYFAYDYDVHLPGIPADAARAEIVWYSEELLDCCNVTVDSLTWLDAHGRGIAEPVD